MALTGRGARSVSAVPTLAPAEPVLPPPASAPSQHTTWRDARQRRFNSQETLVVKSLSKVERVDPKTAARFGTVRPLVQMVRVVDSLPRPRSTLPTLAAFFTVANFLLPQRKREVKSKFNEVLEAFNSLGVSKDASAARTAAIFSGRTKPIDLDRSAGNDAHISATAAILKETHTDAEMGVRQLAEVHGVIQAASAKVMSDNEELERVELTLKEIDSETELAGKVVRNMLKRVYTDKILLVFIALVVLGVAGIIIYSSLVPDNDFNVPDVAKPPTPECVQIMANGGTCT